MRFYIEKNSGFSEVDRHFISQYGAVEEVGAGIYVDVLEIEHLAELGRRYGHVVVTSWPDRADTYGGVILILERDSSGDLTA